MEKEVKQTKKIFKDAWDALNDFFEEKRSDEVKEKIKGARKDEVSLAKFSKGMIGKTNKINFRILIGEDKEPGDWIYEAVYLDDKKEPYLYMFQVNKGRPIKNVLTNFKEDDWNGYKKVRKFKSLTKFLEYSYEEGVYHKGKKQKKEDALNVMIKGLKRALEAVGEDVKDSKGSNDITAQKIAKIVAVAALTTIVSAALTPAAGVLVGELMSGGAISGNVLGDAVGAAGQGMQKLADPVNIVKKVAKKAVTKGRKLGSD